MTRSSAPAIRRLIDGFGVVWRRALARYEVPHRMLRDLETAHDPGNEHPGNRMQIAANMFADWRRR
jgi:hypothetical protein